jgi:transcriptional regulator with XRE-family HTH domain
VRGGRGRATVAHKTDVAERPRVGSLLRDWRRRRRMSQLDLALEAGVSARHLSFVETGRSRPSPDLLLHLAEELEVPLRERNGLLLAAGYAPAFDQRSLEDPEMAAVRDAMQLVLDGHDPYPALVVDRTWSLLAANRGVGLLTAGADPTLLEPPVNCMRLALHPRGLAPRIRNLGEWRAHLLERLRRQVALSGDAELEALLHEVSAYPGPAPGDGAGGETAIAVPLRLDGPGGGELRFISTVTTFGTAVEITAAELSIESFFPADAETAAALRAHGAQPLT